jgi:hypothetical protein
MALDVTSEIVILRPRDVVATFASDPDNVSAWYANIDSVEWETPRPLAIGSRIAFVANFMRRRMAYTYEVVEFVAGERFVMATTEGPMHMETTYEWLDLPLGATKMTLRNRGEPSGFSKLAAPLMAPAVRRANAQDLKRLKALLEKPPDEPEPDSEAGGNSGADRRAKRGGRLRRRAKSQPR